MFRIGHGFDVHAFCAGDHVVLGGVRIEHDHGLLAHSDGDVVLHALCDALFGAAGLGDLGEHYPDKDPKYKGISSRELLEQTLAKVRTQGFVFGNADITVVAQTPRLNPHKAAMKKNIANIIGCESTLVNVKATTTEQLGYLGRAEGLAAHAVVLLSSAD